MNEIIHCLFAAVIYQVVVQDADQCTSEFLKQLAKNDLNNETLNSFWFLKYRYDYIFLM